MTTRRCRRPDGQAALLRVRFGDSGWEYPRILDALDGAPAICLDRVSQIAMPAGRNPWSKGHVTFLGDAASCVSLLGGQGPALAMTAADILAGEPSRTPDNHAGAFARYAALFGPFVAGEQRGARGMARVFAPSSRASLFARNLVFRLMAFPWIARLVASHGLTDRITLPGY
jgi:2-polyprenyl-6-methoxyphenol hydroxylase-like FAD-dependent oxidoreductase